MKRYVIETDKVKVIINKGISFAYKTEVDIKEEDKVLEEASKEVKRFLNNEKNNIIFKIPYTDDPDLSDWLDEQDTYKIRMTDVDLSNQLVWGSNCPYAIDLNSIMII